MKTPTCVHIALSLLLMLTVSQANAKTYCGMLGNQKVELDSNYFSMKPDYEGTSAWESNNFEPKEDCSSKLMGSDKPYDINIFYTPNKDDLYLSRSASSMDGNKDFSLTSDNPDRKVYTKNKTNQDYIERKIVYLDNNKVTEIFECGFNTTTKQHWCHLYFRSQNYNIKIYGSHEALSDFLKARNFSVEFLNKVSIKT
jgi:hypothetical protein